MSSQIRGYDPEQTMGAISADYALTVGRRLHEAGWTARHVGISRAADVGLEDTVSKVADREEVDGARCSRPEMNEYVLGPVYFAVDGVEFCPPNSVAVWTPESPEATE